MSGADKLLEGMRGNPRGDWRIEHFRTIARGFGLRVREGRGSHVVFSHEAVATALVVPAHRPIKPVYVRHFVELIDQIIEQP